MNFSQKGVIAKQRALNAKSGKFGRKLIITFVIFIMFAIVGIGIMGLSAAFGMYNGILASTPIINSNMVAPVGAATFVYDSEGNKIDELVATNSNRIPVTMDKIPKHLADAVVAIEDERFYEHNGVDFMGIVRAGFQFAITGGEEQQGASTITQQLLKNTIFTEWMEEDGNMIKSVKRKLQEQYLAIELTKILSKEEILERYMNTINLGQNTLGVEAAAQRYFGKSASELTISESATIAVITQNPTKYNPISHPEENARRRKDCLDKMLELEFITKAEYDEAIADNVYERIERHNITYLENNTTSSYFVDALTYEVRNDLINIAGYNETQADYALYSGGLRIHSTMDSSIQKIVDEQVANPANYPEGTPYLLNYALSVTDSEGNTQHYSKEMMVKYFRENVQKDFDLIFPTPEDALATIEQYKAAVMQEGDEFSESITITPQPQVSVVIMDQYTGHIVAMSGGRGEKEGRLTYNRATDAYRQPGSTFKVLAAYAPALDTYGLTLASVYDDAPFYYDTGKPVSNWYSENAYKGLCTIRYGIEQSLNIIAVKTLTEITPQLGYDYLESFGFQKLANGLEKNGEVFYDMRQPLALGGITVGVSNKELTAAYATIANNGIYTKPKLYTVVYDSDGNIILDNRGKETHQVLKASTAFLLTDAMEDVVTKGTGTATRFDRNMGIAGKTGTTSNNVDVWFAGFTPYYTCSTWAGYDDNTKMSDKKAYKETNIAKTLWAAIMKEVHAELPAQQFTTPSDVVQMTICSRSGKLPIAGLCDAHLTSEYFDMDNLPTEMCDLHYTGPICAYEVNSIACPECPFQYIGTCELPIVEHESLFQGSTIPVEQPDGTILYITPRTTHYCQHDATFFLDPNYPAILAAQQAEIEERIRQAQELAEQQQQQATE